MTTTLHYSYSYNCTCTTATLTTATATPTTIATTTITTIKEVIYNFNFTSATLQLQLQPQLQHYNFDNINPTRTTTTTTAPHHYIQELWVRWPLQPLQPLQKAQRQPPFGPSVDSLCHPCITTTQVSYSVLALKLPPPPCAVLLVFIYVFIEHPDVLFFRDIFYTSLSLIAICRFGFWRCITNISMSFWVTSHQQTPPTWHLHHMCWRLVHGCAGASRHVSRAAPLCWWMIIVIYHLLKYIYI